MLLPVLTFEENTWVALALFFFVWIYGWAKGNLGSAKLAILFALIVSYLTFYQHKWLVWFAVFIFMFATFGKEIVSKLYIFNPPPKVGGTESHGH